MPGSQSQEGCSGWAQWATPALIQDGALFLMLPVQVHSWTAWHPGQVVCAPPGA
jgi:hypothetical protein